MARAKHEMERPWSDPVVAEVRASRDALFAESGYNLRSFVARLRRDQQAAGHKAVRRPPRSVAE
jgi:hypothetical protein